MFYMVTFEYADGIYCTNLATGTREAVEEKYSGYSWRDVREAKPWEVETAERKGMPIIKC